MNILIQLTDSITLVANQTKYNAPYLLRIFLVLWGIYFINVLLNNRLLYLGIIPRRLYGLPGILCAPFLHANFSHLFFNTIPLLVLSNFLLIKGTGYFLNVTWVIIVVSGILTWCFAKPGIHVGASSVITGYWALLVSNSYHEASITAIILGIVCIYYFAGIFMAVFPGKKGISWEGHLFGLLAGLLVSFL